MAVKYRFDCINIYNVSCDKLTFFHNPKAEVDLSNFQYKVLACKIKEVNEQNIEGFGAKPTIVFFGVQS